EQKSNLEKLWGEEGIATVMLHHSLISHPEFPLFRELYGAQYLLKETEINGRKYGPSTYLHPTDVNIYIVEREHPITAGISDFTINDEVFKNVYYNPHIDVLARTDHPQGDAPVVWTWRYKKTPVFGMIQGDAGGAFNDPNYRKIFYQGVRYIVEQAKK
ncbi:MAG: ThuA domain-containing protein, partial [Planctomycetia bacterium]|nr:ThuA domain-containing protein [Planctomycetia bacterium]